jgi:hypothetical protein
LLRLWLAAAQSPLSALCNAVIDPNERTSDRSVLGSKCGHIAQNKLN